MLEADESGCVPVVLLADESGCVPVVLLPVVGSGAELGEFDEAVVFCASTIELLRINDATAIRKQGKITKTPVLKAILPT